METTRMLTKKRTKIIKEILGCSQNKLIDCVLQDGLCGAQWKQGTLQQLARKSCGSASIWQVLVVNSPMVVLRQGGFAAAEACY